MRTISVNSDAIDRGQAKALRQHQVDRQGENDIVFCFQQSGGFLELATPRTSQALLCSAKRTRFQPFAAGIM